MRDMFVALPTWITRGSTLSRVMSSTPELSRVSFACLTWILSEIDARGPSASEKRIFHRLRVYFTERTRRALS